MCFEVQTGRAGTNARDKIWRAKIKIFGWTNLCLGAMFCVDSNFGRVL